MSRKLSNFIRPRLPARVRRYSHESTTESTVLLLGSFVSPECECRCRVPVAQQHRLTRHTRKVSRYRVSSVSARRAGGRGRQRERRWKGRKRERTRERTHSNVNRTLVRFAAQRRSHRRQRCLTAPSARSIRLGMGPSFFPLSVIFRKDDDTVWSAWLFRCEINLFFIKILFLTLCALYKHNTAQFD